MQQTKTIDYGVCPKCKKIFNAEEACNYQIGHQFIDCPFCGTKLEVFMSIEYLINVLK
jgi:transcription initiation factor IIE alpha subunit